MDPISLLLVGASGLLAYAGFASERSQRNERFGGTPPPSPLPPQSVSKRKMIDRAKTAVEKLIQTAKPQALAALEELDVDINRTIRTTVQKAPFRMFDLISGAALEGTAVLAREVPSEARELLHIQGQIKTIRANTAQRHNLATVTKALTELKGALARNPQLDALTDAMAYRLEIDNVLGLDPLRNAVMILGALGAGVHVGRKILAGQKLGVSTRHGDIALSKNLDYAASLNLKAPRLTQNSLKIVLEGRGIKNLPTVKAATISRGRSHLGVSGSPTAGRAELGLPFVRQGTFTAGVSGVLRGAPSRYSSSAASSSASGADLAAASMRTIGTPSSTSETAAPWRSTGPGHKRFQDPSLTREEIERLNVGLPISSADIQPGVRGFEAKIGMQTIPERGQVQIGVKGTPHTPFQSATLSAPTRLKPGRHGRTATIAPGVSVDPRRGGERRAGIKFNIPI